MSEAAKDTEQVRWDSIDEVPEKWRHLVPPIPPRAWTLDVPRDGPGKPHPDAEARIRAKWELAVKREKLAKQGVPLFARFSDGSVVKCFTAEESRKIIDRMLAFRAQVRGEGWDIDQVIREGRDRDPAKLGGGPERERAEARPEREKEGAS